MTNVMDVVCPCHRTVRSRSRRMSRDPARPSSSQEPAEYKLRIVKEAEGCGAGEVGALLRREGLYPSHLTQLWCSGSGWVSRARPFWSR